MQHGVQCAFPFVRVSEKSNEVVVRSWPSLSNLVDRDVVAAGSYALRDSGNGHFDGRKVDVDQGERKATSFRRLDERNVFLGAQHRLDGHTAPRSMARRAARSASCTARRFAWSSESREVRRMRRVTSSGSTRELRREAIEPPEHARRSIFQRRSAQRRLRALESHWTSQSARASRLASVSLRRLFNNDAPIPLLGNPGDDPVLLSNRHWNTLDRELFESGSHASPKHRKGPLGIGAGSSVGPRPCRTVPSRRPRRRPVPRVRVRRFRARSFCRSIPRLLG